MAQPYRVIVHIFEAVSLRVPGKDVLPNPYATVTVFDSKRTTRIEKETQRVVYNKTMVFDDLFLTLEQFMRASVMVEFRSANILSRHDRIGYAAISLRSVSRQQEHPNQILDEWIPLMNDEDPRPTGLVRATITVLRPGDSATAMLTDPGMLAAAEGGVPGGRVTMPPSEPPSVVPTVYDVTCNIYRGQFLPRTGDAYGETGAAADMNPYVVLRFGATAVATTVLWHSSSPVFNQCLRIPVFANGHADRLSVELWHRRRFGKDLLVATHALSFQELAREETVPHWVNLYGPPLDTGTVVSNIFGELLNPFYERGVPQSTAFLGRMYLSLSAVRVRTATIRAEPIRRVPPEPAQVITVLPLRVIRIEGIDPGLFGSVQVEVSLGPLRHATRFAPLAAASSHGTPVVWFTKPLTAEEQQARRKKLIQMRQRLQSAATVKDLERERRAGEDPDEDGKVTLDGGLFNDVLGPEVIADLEDDPATVKALFGRGRGATASAAAGAAAGGAEAGEGSEKSREGKEADLAQEELASAAQENAEDPYDALPDNMLISRDFPAFLAGSNDTDLSRMEAADGSIEAAAARALAASGAQSYLQAQIPDVLINIYTYGFPHGRRHVAFARIPARELIRPIDEDASNAPRILPQWFPLFRTSRPSRKRQLRAWKARLEATREVMEGTESSEPQPVPDSTDVPEDAMTEAEEAVVGRIELQLAVVQKSETSSKTSKKGDAAASASTQSFIALPKMPRPVQLDSITEAEKVLVSSLLRQEVERLRADEAEVSAKRDEYRKAWVRSIADGLPDPRLDWDPRGILDSHYQELAVVVYQARGLPVPPQVIAERLGTPLSAEELRRTRKAAAATAAAAATPGGVPSKPTVSDVTELKGGLFVECSSDTTRLVRTEPDSSVGPSPVWYSAFVVPVFVPSEAVSSSLMTLLRQSRRLQHEERRLREQLDVAEDELRSATATRRRAELFAAADATRLFDEESRQRELRSRTFAGVVPRPPEAPVPVAEPAGVGDAPRGDPESKEESKGDGDVTIIVAAGGEAEAKPAADDPVAGVGLVVPAAAAAAAAAARPVASGAGGTGVALDVDEGPVTAVSKPDVLALASDADAFSSFEREREVLTRARVDRLRLRLLQVREKREHIDNRLAQVHAHRLVPLPPNLRLRVCMGQPSAQDPDAITVIGEIPSESLMLSSKPRWAPLVPTSARGIPLKATRKSAPKSAGEILCWLTFDTRLTRQWHDAQALMLDSIAASSRPGILMNPIPRWDSRGIDNPEEARQVAFLRLMGHAQRRGVLRTSTALRLARHAQPWLPLLKPFRLDLSALGLRSLFVHERLQNMAMSEGSSPSYRIAVEVPDLATATLGNGAWTRVEVDPVDWIQAGAQPLDTVPCFGDRGSGLASAARRDAQEAEQQAGQAAADAVNTDAANNKQQPANARPRGKRAIIADEPGPGAQAAAAVAAAKGSKNLSTQTTRGNGSAAKQGQAGWFSWLVGGDEAVDSEESEQEPSEDLVAEAVARAERERREAIAAQRAKLRAARAANAAPAAEPPAPAPAAPELAKEVVPAVETSPEAAAAAAAGAGDPTVDAEMVAEPAAAAQPPRLVAADTDADDDSSYYFADSTDDYESEAPRQGRNQMGRAAPADETGDEDDDEDDDDDEDEEPTDRLPARAAAAAPPPRPAVPPAAPPVAAPPAAAPAAAPAPVDSRPAAGGRRPPILSLGDEKPVAATSASATAGASGAVEERKEGEGESAVAEDEGAPDLVPTAVVVPAWEGAAIQRRQRAVHDAAEKAFAAGQPIPADDAEVSVGDGIPVGSSGVTMPVLICCPAALHGLPPITRRRRRFLLEGAPMLPEAQQKTGDKRKSGAGDAGAEAAEASPSAGAGASKDGPPALMSKQSAAGGAAATPSGGAPALGAAASSSSAAATPASSSPLVQDAAAALRDVGVDDPLATPAESSAQTEHVSIDVVRSRMVRSSPQLSLQLSIGTDPATMAAYLRLLRRPQGVPLLCGPRLPLARALWELAIVRRPRILLQPRYKSAGAHSIEDVTDQMGHEVDDDPAVVSDRSETTLASARRLAPVDDIVLDPLATAARELSALRLAEEEMMGVGAEWREASPEVLRAAEWATRRQLQRALEEAEPLWLPSVPGYCPDATVLLYRELLPGQPDSVIEADEADPGARLTGLNSFTDNDAPTPDFVKRASAGAGSPSPAGAGARRWVLVGVAMLPLAPLVAAQGSSADESAADDEGASASADSGSGNASGDQASAAGVGEGAVSANDAADAARTAKAMALKLEVRTERLPTSLHLPDLEVADAVEEAFDPIEPAPRLPALPASDGGAAVTGSGVSLAVPGAAAAAAAAAAGAVVPLEDSKAVPLDARDGASRLINQTRELMVMRDTDPISAIVAEMKPGKSIAAGTPVAELVHPIPGPDDLINATLSPADELRGAREFASRVRGSRSLALPIGEVMEPRSLWRWLEERPSLPHLWSDAVEKLLAKKVVEEAATVLARVGDSGDEDKDVAALRSDLEAVEAGLTEGVVDDVLFSHPTAAHPEREMEHSEDAQRQRLSNLRREVAQVAPPQSDVLRTRARMTAQQASNIAPEVGARPGAVVGREDEDAQVADSGQGWDLVRLLRSHRLRTEDGGDGTQRRVRLQAEFEDLDRLNPPVHVLLWVAIARSSLSPDDKARAAAIVAAARGATMPRNSLMRLSAPSIGYLELQWAGTRQRGSALSGQLPWYRLEAEMRVYDTYNRSLEGVAWLNDGVSVLRLWMPSSPPLTTLLARTLTGRVAPASVSVVHYTPAQVEAASVKQAAEKAARKTAKLSSTAELRDPAGSLGAGGMVLAPYSQEGELYLADNLRWKPTGELHGRLLLSPASDLQRPMDFLEDSLLDADAPELLASMMSAMDRRVVRRVATARAAVQLLLDRQSLEAADAAESYASQAADAARHAREVADREAGMAREAAEDAERAVQMSGAGARAAIAAAADAARQAAKSNRVADEAEVESRRAAALIPIKQAVAVTLRKEHRGLAIADAPAPDSVAITVGLAGPVRSLSGLIVTRPSIASSSRPYPLRPGIPTIAAAEVAAAAQLVAEGVISARDVLSAESLRQALVTTRAAELLANNRQLELEYAGRGLPLRVRGGASRSSSSAPTPTDLTDPFRTISIALLHELVEQAIAVPRSMTVPLAYQRVAVTVLVVRGAGITAPGGATTRPYVRARVVGPGVPDQAGYFVSYQNIGGDGGRRTTNPEFGCELHLDAWIPGRCELVVEVMRPSVSGGVSGAESGIVIGATHIDLERRWRCLTWRQMLENYHAPIESRQLLPPGAARVAMFAADDDLAQRTTAFLTQKAAERARVDAVTDVVDAAAAGTAGPQVGDAGLIVVGPHSVLKASSASGDSAPLSRGSITLSISVVPHGTPYHSHPLASVLRDGRQRFELRVVVWSARQRRGSARVPVYVTGELLVPEAEEAEESAWDWIPGKDFEEPQQTLPHPGLIGTGDDKSTLELNWRMKFPIEAPADGRFIVAPRLRLRAWEDRPFYAAERVLSEAVLELAPLIREATEGLTTKAVDKSWIPLKGVPGPYGSKGKLQIEASLVPWRDAEARPVGYGRDEPNRDPFIREPTIPEQRTLLQKIIAALVPFLMLGVIVGIILGTTGGGGGGSAPPAAE